MPHMQPYICISGRSGLLMRFSQTDMGPAIYTRMFGGVGNQLFQYSASRGLVDKLGCDLVVDTRYLAGLNLANCMVHFSNARYLENVNLPPFKNDGLLKYIGCKFLSYSPKSFRDSARGYNPDLKKQPPSTYLRGYWQSERYFADISDKLRSGLEFTTPLTGANADFVSMIKNSANPVGVHFRRGDYLKNDAFSICASDYYAAAMDYIAINDCQSALPTRFVFSNDPDWARKNVSLGFETVFVDVNSEKTGHFDLHLQSLCNHNIIANSTFSWWSAWLNSNPDKIAIGPQKWFTSDRRENPDIYPKGRVIF